MLEISLQVTHDGEDHTLPSLSNWTPVVATSSDCNQSLLMTTALGELRRVTFICLPIWMFFSVDALNQNKRKSTLLWTYGKKEYGLLFLKLMK